MTRQEKVHWLTKLVADKHGSAAPLVEKGRAEECRSRGDHDAHAVWKEIRAVLAQPAGNGTKATLGDLLGGNVTRQVMAADGVATKTFRRCRCAPCGANTGGSSLRELFLTAHARVVRPRADVGKTR